MHRPSRIKYPSKVIIIVFISLFMSIFHPAATIYSVPTLGPPDGGSDVLSSVVDQPIEGDPIEAREDYLDEVVLRQHVKSLLADQARDAYFKLPEASVKAVFSAQVQGKVALSFDDGPYEDLTEKYLEVLQRHDVGATFFMVGNRVKAFPEEAKKIAEAGFDMGIHSFSHSQLIDRDAEWVSRDFSKAVDAIKDVTGVKVNLFRPPYGDYDETTLKVAVEQGLHTIRWNVDPRDWQIDDPQKIVDNILTYSTHGSIILMHEGRYSTLEALPDIINGLRDRGFEIVSVSELIAEEHSMEEEPL